MQKKDLYTAVCEQLDAFIKVKRLRQTATRKRILQILCNEPTPITVAHVLLRAADENISRASVYNAIDLFVQARILQCIGKAADKKYRQYEFYDKHHTGIQLVCTRCGLTKEINDKLITSILRTRPFTNFELKHYSVIIYGKCKICRSKVGKSRIMKQQ